MKVELQSCFALNLLVALIFINIFLLTPVAATNEPYLVNAAEYDFFDPPLLESEPHGKLNVIVIIKKLWYDGDPDYDWYPYYKDVEQMVPGAVAYGSDWRNGHLWANHTLAYPGVNRWLVDYGPKGTTQGQTTVSYSITGGPSPGFTVGWSYSIADVIQYDKSDFAEYRAMWEHDIQNHAGDPRPVEISTWAAEPSLVVKTKQNYWSLVDSWYKVHFDDFLGWFLGIPLWDYKALQSDILWLDAYKYGDSTPPETPSTPSGPTSGYTYTTYDYSTSTVDFDDDYIRYEFDWDDGSTTTTGWYPSGATATASHSWSSPGTHYVKVRAQDETYTWSGWSPSLTVTIESPGVWVSPTGHEDPDDNWIRENEAYDDNEATASGSNIIFNCQWLGYLILTHDSITSYKIRLMVYYSCLDRIVVDVHRNGQWINVFDGVPMPLVQWVEIYFDGGEVDALRITGHSTADLWQFPPGYLAVYEADFWEVEAPP